MESPETFYKDMPKRYTVGDKIEWLPVSEENQALVLDGHGGTEVLSDAIKRRFPPLFSWGEYTIGKIENGVYSIETIKPEGTTHG